MIFYVSVFQEIWLALFIGLCSTEHVHLSKHIRKKHWWMCHTTTQQQQQIAAVEITWPLKRQSCNNFQYNSTQTATSENICRTCRDILLTIFSKLNLLTLFWVMTSHTQQDIHTQTGTLTCYGTGKSRLKKLLITSLSTFTFLDCK